MRSGVNIELKRQAGSGKTAILHIIGETLRNSDFNVVAVYTHTLVGCKLK